MEKFCQDRYKAALERLHAKISDDDTMAELVREVADLTEKLRIAKDRLAYLKRTGRKVMKP